MNSVCTPSFRMPRKKSPWLCQYQSYISNWYVNGKVFTSTTTWEPKFFFFFSKKFEIEFELYFDLCWRAEIIQVGLNMHLYVDIGDASSSLWGSTSSTSSPTTGTNCTRTAEQTPQQTSLKSALTLDSFSASEKNPIDTKMEGEWTTVQRKRSSRWSTREKEADRNPGGDGRRGGRSMERRVDGRTAGRTGGGRSESRRRLHSGAVERGENLAAFPPLLSSRGLKGPSVDQAHQEQATKQLKQIPTAMSFSKPHSSHPALLRVLI